MISVTGRHGDEIGTLAAGKTVDIIAVIGSPLRDVTQLEHVAFVMHRGRVVRARSGGL